MQTIRTFARLVWMLVLGIWSLALCPALICLCLLTTACTSPQPGAARWWAPNTWFKATEATTLAKATAAEEKATTPLLTTARDLAHETQLALASAPPSRPVEVATHSATQAATLLDQLAGPLTAQQAQDLRTRIAHLLSEEAKIRTQAEADRASRDRALSRLSDDYQDAQAALTKAQGDLATAFQREHAVAQEARAFRAKLWWGGGLLALLWLLAQGLPLLAHAFPAVAPLASITNLLQPGAAYVTTRLRKGLQRIGQTLAEAKPDDRDYTIALLDPLLDRDHQEIIRAARAKASGGILTP